MAVGADMRDTQQVKRMVGDVTDRWGSLNIWVNYCALEYGSKDITANVISTELVTTEATTFAPEESLRGGTFMDDPLSRTLSSRPAELLFNMV